MHIELLDTSVSLPIELKEDSELLGAVPKEVEARAKEGKIWHLIAWTEHEQGLCGFYRKKVSLVLPRTELASVIINVMKPAKGRGWVTLEVKRKGEARFLPVFESTFFNPDAVLWFLKHKSQLETILGLEIEVNELGSDY